MKTELFKDENIFLITIGPALDLTKIAQDDEKKLPENLAKIILTNRLRYSDLEHRIFIGDNEERVLNFAFDYFKQYRFMPYSAVSLKTLLMIKNSFINIDDKDIVLLDKNSQNIFFVETLSKDNKIIPHVVKSEKKQQIKEYFKEKDEKVITFYDKANLSKTINMLNNIKIRNDDNYYVLKEND